MKSKGIFVDIRGLEVLNVDRNFAGTNIDVHVSKASFEQAFQIAPAFVLPPNETKQFDFKIRNRGSSGTPMRIG